MEVSCCGWDTARLKGCSARWELQAVCTLGAVDCGARGKELRTYRAWRIGALHNGASRHGARDTRPSRVGAGFSGHTRFEIVYCAGALCVVRGEVAGTAVPYPATVGAPLRRTRCAGCRQYGIHIYMTRALRSAWYRNTLGPWTPPRANTRGTTWFLLSAIVRSGTPVSRGMKRLARKVSRFSSGTVARLSSCAAIPESSPLGCCPLTYSTVEDDFL